MVALSKKEISEALEARGAEIERVGNACSCRIGNREMSWFESDGDDRAALVLVVRSKPGVRQGVEEGIWPSTVRQAVALLFVSRAIDVMQDGEGL